MRIQLRDDMKAIRLDLEGLEMFDLAQATQIASDLLDAVQQCGGTVKMNVDVPKHSPTDEQIKHAVSRVGLLRRTYADRAWNDTKTNLELVMRVLEACL